jgi:hypothetical protein
MWRAANPQVFSSLQDFEIFTVAISYSVAAGFSLALKMPKQTM